MMSMSTQSGRLAGISRSASVLERLTETTCPAFSRRLLAISVWTALSSTPYTLSGLPILESSRRGPWSVSRAAKSRRPGRALARRPGLPDHERHDEAAGSGRGPDEPAALSPEVRADLLSLRHSHRDHDDPVAGRAPQPD